MSSGLPQKESALCCCSCRSFRNLAFAMMSSISAWDREARIFSSLACSSLSSFSRYFSSAPGKKE